MQTMSEQPPSYGTTRERGPTVSYSEVERAARAVMARGLRPTSKAVLEHLGRGSPNHIGECLQRFWKDQAALNAGDPIALSRLPPELADAALEQWEKALRLAQQTVNHEDSAARAQLERLRSEAELRIRSVELREKEWDMAARVRERALADSRAQISALMKELSLDRVALRARDARIVDLEGQIEAQRREIISVVAAAVAKNRARSGVKLRPHAPVNIRKRAGSRTKRRLPKPKLRHMKKKRRGTRRKHT